MPTMQAWENFISEYKLDVEVATFTINNKCHYFIRIGLYNASRHPALMPICHRRDWQKKAFSSKV
jgi:hypothetical protein